MRLKQVITGLILLLTLAACSIETAKTPPQRKLIIASDYLQAKDTLLFHRFAKENAVHISIETMSADSLIERIRTKQANSGIDVVVLESLYDVTRLDKRGLFHPIDLRAKTPEAIHYSSLSYNYIGFGIDPYIIAHEQNNSYTIKTYNDLTHFNYVSALAQKHAPILLAPILKNLTEEQKGQWIKQYTKHAISKPIPRDSLLNDSLFNRLPILTTQSNFKLNKVSNSTYKSKTLLFPKKTAKDCYYNLRSLAVISQASNYTTAISFIDFCTTKKVNLALNEVLNTSSIYSNQYGIKQEDSPIEKQIPLYSNIELLLEK
ncbi:MAG: hypothetical protein P8N52_02850 [Crocinitomicaceae bacterium]|nr:hypothetical protein [Crocinitomicaceae bacterium]MDG1775906.1 hypothetical protein [Crocinitomicaceae bacterium]